MLPAPLWEDVWALYPLTLTSSVEGIVTGRVIYTVTLDLHAAMEWIAAQ
ncbi:hypothetical protein ACR4XJ_12830 [Nitratidesulfovibrio sp. D1]